MQWRPLPRPTGWCGGVSAVLRSYLLVPTLHQAQAHATGSQPTNHQNSQAPAPSSSFGFVIHLAHPHSPVAAVPQHPHLVHRQRRENDPIPLAASRTLYLINHFAHHEARCQRLQRMVMVRLFLACFSPKRANEATKAKPAQTPFHSSC